MDWESAFSAAKTASGRQSILENIESGAIGGLPRRHAALRYALLTLRNACIEEQAYSVFVQCGWILPVITDVVQFCAQSSTLADVAGVILDEPAGDDEKKALVLGACQFFANFTAAHAAAADWMTSSAALSHIFAAAVVCKSPKALAVSWNVLYNCMCAGKPGADARLELIIASRSILCQALLALCDSSQRDDALFEWTLLSAVCWLQGKKARAIFAAVASSVASTCQEQVILLQLISLVLEDPTSTRHLSDQQQRDFWRETRDLCDQVARHLCALSPLAATQPAGGEESVEDARERDLRQQVQHSFEVTAMSLLSVAVSREEATGWTHSLTQQHSLVSHCLRIVDGKDVGTLRRQKLASSPSASAAESAANESDKILVLHALQLLSNLIYTNRPAADQVLAYGLSTIDSISPSSSSSHPGVNTLLCHCVTDFSNPLTREWALLSIRNLCECHEDVPKYIATLQPQDAVVVDEGLAAAGLQVRFDTATGRFAVRQDPPAPPSSQP